MAKKPTCGLCNYPKVLIETANAKTWVCANCDQYPWMIQEMTQDERAARSAKARAVVEEAQK